MTGSKSQAVLGNSARDVNNRYSGLERDLEEEA